jgi:hypothetical protein
MVRASGRDKRQCYRDEARAALQAARDYADGLLVCRVKQITELPRQTPNSRNHASASTCSADLVEKSRLYEILNLNI